MAEFCYPEVDFNEYLTEDGDIDYNSDYDSLLHECCGQIHKWCSGYHNYLHTQHGIEWYKQIIWDGVEE